MATPQPISAAKLLQGSEQDSVNTLVQQAQLANMDVDGDAVANGACWRQAA